MLPRIDHRWFPPAWIAAIAVLAVLLLGGCAGFRAKPTPPLVTPCLDEPRAAVPDEPDRPLAGEIITDRYIVALTGYANALLGTITSDRITWRGERRCIRKLQEAGDVR